MDVDNDPIDQSLLLQFTCLGTTDRDDLVKQFIQLVDNRVDDTTASFFLEMNNWNLQNSICSFFDFETPSKLPAMKKIDETPLSRSLIPPNTEFSMKWVIRNDGDESWPQGCYLQYSGGDHPCNVNKIPVRGIAPGLSVPVIVDFIAPSESGSYWSRWQMVTPSGTFFGEVLYVSFQVGFKLNDTEEVRLSEELASRMALIDNDFKAMEDELDYRPSNFFDSRRREQIEKMSDIEQGDKKIS